MRQRAEQVLNEVNKSTVAFDDLQAQALVIEVPEDLMTDEELKVFRLHDVPKMCAILDSVNRELLESAVGEEKQRLTRKQGLMDRILLEGRASGFNIALLKVAVEPEGAEAEAEEGLFQYAVNTVGGWFSWGNEQPPVQDDTAPNMPSVECGVEVEVEAPKAPKMPSVEVEVEVEVEAPKAPKMPSVECEVEVEVEVAAPYGFQVYQCQIGSPGVGYRHTPSFADKVPDGTGPQSPDCIIATAMEQGPQAVFVRCSSGRGWLPLTNPSASRICFKHLGEESEIDFEKRDLHLADGSVKFKKNADWYKKDAEDSNGRI